MSKPTDPPFEPTYEQKKILIQLKPADVKYLHLAIPHMRVYLPRAAEKIKVPARTVCNCVERVRKRTGLDGYTFLGFLQLSKAVTAGQKYLREKYPKGIPKGVTFQELFGDEIL